MSEKDSQENKSIATKPIMFFKNLLRRFPTDLPIGKFVDKEQESIINPFCPIDIDKDEDLIQNLTVLIENNKNKGGDFSKRYVTKIEKIKEEVRKNKGERFFLLHDGKLLSSKNKKLYKYIGYCTFLIVITLILVFLVIKIKSKEIWNTNPCSKPKEINNRQLQRGTITSIINAFIFGTCNYGLVKFGNVDPPTSTALFGLVLGCVVGFIGDNFIGTDIGYRLYKDSKANAFNYAFGVIGSAKFSRYLITILLDLFISMSVYAVAYPLLLQLPFFRCHTTLSNSMLIIVISITTFFAYANQTRFLWAYPDINVPKAHKIQYIVVYLAVILAGVMFLQQNTCVQFKKPDLLKQPKRSKNCVGINNPKVKGMIIIIVLFILSALTLSGSHESKEIFDIKSIFVPTGEKRSEVEDETVLAFDEREMWNNHQGETGSTNQGKIQTLVYKNDIPEIKKVIQNSNIGKLLFSVLLIVTISGCVYTSYKAMLTGSKQIISLSFLGNSITTTKQFYSFSIFSLICVIVTIITIFSIKPKYAYLPETNENICFQD